MQKIIVMLGLLLSIAGASYAQQTENAQPSPDDRIFQLPDYSIKVIAWADLGKGNVMQLRLTERAAFARFQNIDSLLLVFQNDMKSLQDSLSDPLTSKRIDYLMDAEGHKKIRIRQTRPAASTYLVENGEPALLKLQQDTILLYLAAPPDNAAKKPVGQRYDRLAFFLNRYEELNGLITTGLNRKVTLMQSRPEGAWMREGDRREHLKADPTISRRANPKGLTRAELSFQYKVTIQNYKNYFTPSFDLGMAFSILDRGRRNTFSLDWEPVFLFAHDAQGRLQTYRNDLLVFGYRNSKSPFLGVPLNFTLGYLIHRQGDYFVPHTFRLSVASIELAKKRIMIQPCMYFNDFLKGVTPGVRVTF